MGAMQTKKRSSNKCDSSTQTPPFARRQMPPPPLVPMGRCSSFANNIQSPLAAVTSTNSSLLPPSKRPRYDPVYAAWKTSFEGAAARLPRKCSPIRERITRAHDMTDAVAGQLTPKGFPSYTKLQKNRDNTTQSSSSSDKQKDIEAAKSFTKVRRRLSLRLSQNYPVKSIAEEDKHQLLEASASESRQEVRAKAKHRESDSDEERKTTNNTSTGSKNHKTNNAVNNNGNSSRNIVSNKPNSNSIIVNNNNNNSTLNNNNCADDNISKTKPQFLTKVPTTQITILERIREELQTRRKLHSNSNNTNENVKVYRTPTPTSRSPAPSLPARRLPQFLDKLSNVQADVLEKVYNNINSIEETCTTRKVYYYL